MGIRACITGKISTNRNDISRKRKDLQSTCSPCAGFPPIASQSIVSQLDSQAHKVLKSHQQANKTIWKNKRPSNLLTPVPSPALPHHSVHYLHRSWGCRVTDSKARCTELHNIRRHITNDQKSWIRGNRPSWNRVGLFLRCQSSGQDPERERGFSMQNGFSAASMASMFPTTCFATRLRASATTEGKAGDVASTKYGTGVPSVTLILGAHPI
jgi:hypothetical protein